MKVAGVLFMSLPKVAIDLKTILDPFKMMAVISEIDNTYSEILIADQLQLIEIGLVGDQTLGLDLLKEPTFPNGAFWSGIFGCCDSNVYPDNFMIGLKLLRKAYDIGMVNTYDSEHFSKVGREIFSLKEQYTPYYVLESPNKMKVRICPDWGFQALDSMIGAEAILGAVPVYNDKGFYNYIIKNKPEGTILGKCGNVSLNESEQGILEWPKVDNLEELFKMRKELRPKYSVSPGLKIGQPNNKEVGKEIGLMTFEFISTNAVDNLIFQGIPVSGTIVLGYKTIKKILTIK